MKTATKFTLLTIILLLTAALSIALGATNLDFKELLAGTNPAAQNILLQIRLPRTLLAATAGIMLGGAGAAFQLLFRNPLAEPGIMGITSGATLGAVSAACFAGGAIINAGSFLGALIAGLAVALLSQTREASTTAILLCGTALGTLYSALTSITLSLNSQKIQSMYIWMLGSFSGRGWNELKLVAIPALISIPALLLLSPKLDLLYAGETTAAALGLEVQKLRTQTLLAGTLAASAAVCAGGTIGFIGLIAPHCARKLAGPKARVHLPASMLCGAIILLISDTVCRTAAAPAEIPVGTVTALLGAPFFVWLLLSKK